MIRNLPFRNIFVLILIREYSDAPNDVTVRHIYKRYAIFGHDPLQSGCGTFAARFRLVFQFISGVNCHVKLTPSALKRLIQLLGISIY